MCSTTPNAGTVAPNLVYNCAQIARPANTSATAGTNSVISRAVQVKESELAGFGEANYYLTSTLKATAGVRVARISVHYTQRLSGSVYGDPNPDQGFTATPGHPFALGSDTYYTITDGTQVETPVTPHFGVSWEATRNYLFYFSAAKGYRAGGVNAPASLGNCATQLAQLGTDQTPASYNSDSVWSYEGGAKLRLFGGHAQINSSLFRIDWKDPQLTI